MKRVVGMVVLGLVACSSEVPVTGASPPGTVAVAPEHRATGELTSWETLPAMPVARGNHCAVVANGFLVVVGGNHKPKGAKEFVTVADVHAAKIGDDGSIGEWKLAGKAPSPVSSCTAASDGKDVYLVDGIFQDEAAGSRVRRASVSAAGDLGEWQDLGALPKGVRVLYSQATVTGGALRAFHARLPDAGDGIALASAAVSGPALGAWQESTWLTGFRGQPQYAHATLEGGRSFVYVLGGYSSGDKGNEVLADGAGAPLDDEGMPGKSFPVKPLPKATSFGKAFAVDDWIFVIGGKDVILTGSGRADVFAAKIGADGALGDWQTVASLPQGRTSHSVAVHGDFVYVIGGGFDAGGLDTVFSARVRHAR